MRFLITELLKVNTIAIYFNIKFIEKLRLLKRQIGAPIRTLAAIKYAAILVAICRPDIVIVSVHYLHILRVQFIGTLNYNSSVPICEFQIQ